jgi:hypothetical protein
MVAADGFWQRRYEERWANVEGCGNVRSDGQINRKVRPRETIKIGKLKQGNRKAP